MAESTGDGADDGRFEFESVGAPADTVVVLAVADDATRRALREWFESERYDVHVVDPSSLPADADPSSLPADADLFVVDERALRETADHVGDCKAASEAFVPCLLVVDGTHADDVAASTDPSLDVVDDVLRTPLRTPSLRRRVEGLLRTRTASVRLRDQRSHLECLVDILPAGLFVLDDDDTVTYANAAGARLLDASVDGLAGTRFVEFVHSDDRDEVAALLADERDTETVQVRLVPDGCDRGDEHVFENGAENDVLVVELTVASVPADRTTQVLVHDVTERERRTERLGLFERAISEAGVGISIADARLDDHPLVFVNDGFCDVTGYEREAVLGRNCRFLQGADTDPETVATIREAIDTERSIATTVRNYRADGTPFWNHLEVTPVTDDDGAVTHFLGFQRDVTERRERMRLFEHLHGATERLQRAATPEAVAEAAVDSLGEILELDVVVCWFPNADRTRLDPVAARGVDATYSLEPGSPDWRAYVDRTNVTEVPVTDHDVDRDAALLFSLGEHGVVGAADPEREYTDAVRDAGAAFADHVTVALDRAVRQAELANTTRDLENTLERINDGFIALDDEFVVTYVNERATAFLPVSADELVGEVFWDVLPEAVGTEFYDQYLAAMETQEPRTFESYYEAYETWFEVAAYPSEDGLTLYVRDVTEKHERERELERYETIVETASDPIYTLDHDGHFASVNQAFCDLTGYDREAVVGAHASIVLPDADVRRAERAIADLLSAGGECQRTVEITVVTAGGDRRDCEAAIAVLPEDEFEGTVGVVRDLTELKENEQRLSVLDRVLRHNLRNNMNVVAGQASTLADHDDDAVARVAREVEAAARDVLNMAEKARAFQHALGGDDTAVSETDLVALAQEVADDVAATNPDATVQFDCDDEPVVVWANEAVSLAVHELVENAVVHNPSDGPRAYVRVARDGEHAVVEVVDDGPPIPDDETEILENGVETPLEHTSGLGLWLAHWTATSFGGDLAFDATDRGNVVTLRLRLADAD